MTTDTSIQPNILETDPEVESPVSGFKKWAPLVVLALALAIIIIDTTILNVSLRTIIGDLNTDIKSIQWVITAYALMLAAFTITGGRLGDLFGRKKMFIVGAIIFAIGSFITSISHSVGPMIIGEAIIEGLGAVLMMPATSSLLLSNYRGKDRALAFGVWGGIAAASAALGPVVGGWLTTNYSWRWAFRINILVVIVLILGSLLIRESRDTEEKPELDVLGIILSSLGLLSMVYGFIESSTYGWFRAKEQLVLWGYTLDLGSLSVTPVFVGLGLFILILFGFWQKYRMSQGKTPLVSLNLFKNRQFVVGSIITAVMSIGMAGLSFSIPVFFQGVRNLDPLHTGIAMLPMPLAILVSAPLSAFLVKFIDPKRLVQIALLITVAGFAVMNYELGVDATAWSLAPGFAIFGFGMGLMFAQLSNLTLSAVSVQESGEASGVNNTFRQVGQTLGSAILGAVLISSLGLNLVSGVMASQAIPEQAKPFISETVSKQASSIEFGGSSSGTSAIPLVIKNELTNIIHSATTDASREVTVYGAGFMLLAFISSFWLVGAKNVKNDLSAASMTVTGSEAKLEPEPEPELEPEKETKIEPEPEVKPEPESDPESKVGSEPEARPELVETESYNSSVKKVALIAIGAAIILAGSAGATGYYFGKKNMEPPVVVVEPEVISTAPLSDRTWTPLFNPTVPPIPVDSSTVAVIEKENTGAKPQVAGASTTVPSNDPELVPVHTYADSNLKFKMDIPNNWKVESKSTEVTITTPDHHGLSIQAYQVNSNDIAGLQEFLDKQPNIKNISATKFNGYKSFSFEVVGYYKKGIAFLSDGKLYYILGTTLSDSALNSFKTL